MSEYLKIQCNKNYFITLTIVEWIDLFTRECYVDILIASIKYCQKNKGLDLYAYVIMPSHIHMIAGTDDNLSNILRDMKEHTSKIIIKEILENPKESRREWLIEMFTRPETGNRKAGYKVWQSGNYPVELHSIKFINQKEQYIHRNPVKAGIVIYPEDYRLSSASKNSPLKVLPIR